MTWKYAKDTDTRGNLGFRVDSQTASLIAWFPIGNGAEDAEANAKLACDSVNAARNCIDDVEETRRGELLAHVLGLRFNREGRTQTQWGTKTALGLYRTVKRIVEEGK